MKQLLRILSLVDYSVGIATLAYAAYAQSWLWAAAGILGLVIAWLKPAVRIRAWVERTFTPKRRRAASIAVPNDSPLDALPSTAAPATSGVGELPAAPVGEGYPLVPFGGRYRGMTAMRSKHNALKGQTLSPNFYPSTPRSTFL